MSDMSTTERLAREVKNSLCIDGTLNSVLEAVLLSKSPDTTMALLTGLAHLAVNRACRINTPASSDRCPCGYPMPCVKTVPVEFCKA